MARGDHLRANRVAHHHDGIDLGNGEVVHFAAGPGGSKYSAVVQVSTLEEFARGGVVSVRPYDGESDPEVIVARALSRVGESGYHLVFNNCEHFARWCVTGEHQSEQVTAVGSLSATGALASVAGTLGLSLIGSIGYPGVSGPGLMSGAATVGGLVGGGALAGLGLIGLAPAAVGAGILASRRFSQDKQLPAPERRARRAGQVGAVAGGTVGLLGASWAITNLGVAGTSGAGISSGLAAIGAVVRGGMATGVALAIVAPIAGVVFGAYLFHWVWNWIERQRTKSTGPNGGEIA